FFQAEDGIRYFHVTGVQTCALPISTSLKNIMARKPSVFSILSIQFSVKDCADCFLFFSALNTDNWELFVSWKLFRSPQPRTRSRSEERRVGKECRYRWGLTTCRVLL